MQDKKVALLGFLFSAASACGSDGYSEQFDSSASWWVFTFDAPSTVVKRIDKTYVIAITYPGDAQSGLAIGGECMIKGQSSDLDFVVKEPISCQLASSFTPPLALTVSDGFWNLADSGPCEEKTTALTSTFHGTFSGTIDGERGSGSVKFGFSGSHIGNICVAKEPPWRCIKGDCF